MLHPLNINLWKQSYIWAYTFFILMNFWIELHDPLPYSLLRLVLPLVCQKMLSNKIATNIFLFLFFLLLLLLLFLLLLLLLLLSLLLLELELKLTIFISPKYVQVVENPNANVFGKIFTSDF